jgi:exodeoxyribonuclease VII large subunit
MQQSLFSLETRKTYSVTELNARIRTVFEKDFGEIFVSGEISGAKLAPSGHYYFTLKDGESQVKCACFRMSARYLKFKPADGVAVIARGRLDVYDARGEYQLIVEHLEPQGFGALQFAFEQLKKKLAAEGLFDNGRKRPLPKYPRRIGLVTSPSGAVIQDMLNILCRRFPGLHIRLYPAQVQGEGSVEQVVRGLRWFSESNWAEVVIVARGGGSLEDLWTFNEEPVARAIVASTVPVVSAVGHETDFTIADFVADLRAPTPSAAAELVVPTREQVLESLSGCRRVLEQHLRYRLSIAARRLHERGIDRATTIVHRSIGRAFQRIDDIERCSADNLRRILRGRRQSWNGIDARLRRMDLRLQLAEARRRHHRATECIAENVAEIVQSHRRRLDSLVTQLRHLSPLNVLERGYAIVQDEAGHIVKQSASAPPGTAIKVRLAEGSLAARVTDVIPSGSSELPL